MADPKSLKKDSPTRSILKAFSWRVIASATTFAITYFIVLYSTDQNSAKALQFASTIASVDVVAKRKAVDKYLLGKILEQENLEKKLPENA